MASQPASAPPRDTGRRVRRILWVLVGTLLLAVIAWYAVLTLGKPQQAAPPARGMDILVRADSHRLTAPDVEKAQLVEFLDFECPPCAAVHPVAEELKAEFGDRITFVSRHFPLPSHPNSKQAALAVEAAAQQGQYQQMAGKMFQTQSQWAGRQESQAPLFRNYAEQLGLDLALFDAAVADPKTSERIVADISDGKVLGVTGTPTFFLTGEKLTLTTKADFRQQLADAVK